MATHLYDPLLTGNKLTGDTGGPNFGYASLTQTTSITQNSTTAVSSTINIPAGSRISSFTIDVLTAYDSATSATLSIGLTAAATQYVSGVDVKAATGRIAITFTAAQLAAMAGVSIVGVAAPIAAPGPLVVTVTVVGATTAGYVWVTAHYTQLLV